MTDSMLYHFTSYENWDGIRASRLIKLGSPAEQLGGHVPVIWFQDTPNPKDNGIGDRHDVRITLTPHPSIRYWMMWGRLGANFNAVNSAGGSSETWYVSEEPIPADYWQSVMDTATGQDLDPNGTVPASPAAWGLLPTSGDVDSIATFLTQAAAAKEDGDECFRATLVFEQVKQLRTMLQAKETEQRIRAAWRTLTAEAARFQTWHEATKDGACV
ncbi:hypothetical protein [Streptomyces sp. NPDC048659]|uniref:hypothetical protein n=1 Tax=Streptomyces sp. NPDC048659 TaxID=3155489 RepID=UPI003437DEE9